jgi:hypothetical protein
VGNSPAVRVNSVPLAACVRTLRAGKRICRTLGDSGCYRKVGGRYSPGTWDVTDIMLGDLCCPIEYKLRSYLIEK